MKVLIIGPSWVGDMVMSQSLYRTLKKKNPNCHITVLAPDWCRAILSRMAEVDAILAMPIGHGKLELKHRWQIARSLKAQKFDQAIVLPGSLKSALIPWLARIPIRTGWLGEMRFGLLNDYRKLNKPAFPMMVERYVALAFDKNEITKAKDLPEPILWPSLSTDSQRQEKLRIHFRLHAEHPTLAICPGAEFGPAKRWPDYHYATLCEKIILQGWQVVIFGSQKDQLIGEQIIQALPTELNSFCLNLAGQTKLEEAVDLMASCHAVVSNDSGLMHVAAALNLPLVALYGPSSPDFTPPLSNKAHIIRLISGYHKVRRGDGEQGYHQSLIDIQPQQVFDALQNQLIPQQGNE